jgi:hypothetical protein
MKFCPVCMLRKGLAGGVDSDESSSGETLNPTSDQPGQRFEHYELVTGKDGEPVELGRGAMGVTYKAFDVDLRVAGSAARFFQWHTRSWVWRLHHLWWPALLRKQDRAVERASLPQVSLRRVLAPACRSRWRIRLGRLIPVVP